MDLLIIAIANLLIGAFIGISGVAGFLLPMLYTGLLAYSIPKALALSFLAFIISGALGSWNYHRQGNLDVRFSLVLSAGSLVGAIGGVFIQSFIAPSQAKLLLYAVVFLSGLSILLRKEGKAGSGSDAAPKTAKRSLLDSTPFTVIFGLVTGAVCSLSGAGGPVLVMPLLVSFGMNIRTAIGVSLLNSVFIGIPACIGYFAQSPIAEMPALIAVSAIAHGIGVILGSRQAHRVKQRPLKLCIAVFSVLLSAYMIFSLYVK